MCKCEMIKDLLPLYEEDLVSEQTKKEIEEHLKSCANCSSLYRAPLPKIEVPINEQEKKGLKQLKRMLTRQQYFAVFISLILAVYLFLQPLAGIDTIPWIVLIPFCLTLLYQQPKKIFYMLLVMMLCLMITTKQVAYCIVMFLQIFIFSTCGVALASWILRKHKSTTMQILSLIICGGLFGYALMAYSSTKGTLLTYWQAKTAIQAYIDDVYDQQLILTNVRYNPKEASYLGDVVDQEDSRNSGTIYCYIKGNEIYDDYHFRTQLKMEDEVQQVLELFIAVHSDINAWQLSLYPQIDVPINTYKSTDSYDPTLPVSLNILDDITYDSKEAFAKQCYELLQVLQFSGLRFETISIYSFLEDGNRTYTLKTSNLSLSLEEIIHQLTIEDSLKGKEFGI
ncbi:zf-HC2 domain-containing protein [Turicibacter bilis]|uniref:Zf-HC2 domain-containing protein n=1 Tax=Turicibacter bilis TaxID=2735723 RepID=A0ABY5JDW2_9FIRM|nr:zf-HC2 domain-containing protein [Turicibacter bilis]MBS3201631.1 zf-HC2 domain-containing protein [Turicibacter bilis]MDO5794729.1 zf-HC2 domain-containing protein [Turicibacter sp.]UUF04865.1 zf-HC2 domain-containing protein [Turicibacter bilis]